MIDRDFLRNRKWQEQQWRALRKWPPPRNADGVRPSQYVGAYPQLLAFEQKLVKELAKMGVPVFCVNMVRDSAWQDALKAKGNSKTSESAHEYGCAFDLVHSTKGWELDKRQWALIGHVGKETATRMGVKVVWGGDWTFYDPAHWELANWRDMKGEFPWPIITLPGRL